MKTRHFHLLFPHSLHAYSTMTSTRPTAKGRASQNSYNNQLAPGEDATGVASLHLSYRSEDRTETDDYGTSMKEPISVRIRQAIANNPNMMLVYNATTQKHEIIFTDANGVSFDLLRDKSSHGGTHASALIRDLKKFPGTEVERMDATYLTAPYKLTERIRIYTTLDYDVFNDIDFLRRLQNCQDFSKANKVARKINRIIASAGIGGLPEVLGRGILP